MSGIQQGLVASLGGKLIELAEVFNATVYTGNGASRTITTNIDTLNEGGLIWIKNLQRSVSGHGLFSTANGGSNFLTPAGHDGSRILSTAGLSGGAGSSDIGFTAAGFTLGTDTSQAINNFYVQDYLALTMRKAPKFFDVVTYTGTGSTQTIAHNLGSTPGMIIIKRTDGASFWWVYHRSLGNAATINLDRTDAETTGSDYWASTSPTSSVFTVGASGIGVNNTGESYVAFVFAHEAGGFGASRTQNAVSCGSYTGTGSTVQVNCGFASSARFVMVKRTDSTGSWFMWDSTRGIIAGNDPYLLAQTQAAQITATDDIDTFSTGFEIPAGSVVNTSTASYIYLAIA
jgi:hypothetical protein